MDTVVAASTFEGDLESLIAYCRTLNSRANWPGAVLEWEKPDTLYWQVGVRLKAASMVDIEVEERLGGIVRFVDGRARFDSVQRGAWPHGHMDSACEYLFTQGTGGEPHSLQVTYSYVTPPTTLVRTRELPVYHQAMGKVIGAYVSKLTTMVPAAT